MVLFLQLSSWVWLVVSSTGLVLFCLCADHLIFKRDDLWHRLPIDTSLYGLPEIVALRAVSDSLVHGLVGGWCWMNVGIILSGEVQKKFNSLRLLALQIVTSMGLAAVIDLDHMIEARSLWIKDALALRNRPFAHNSTLIPIITAALYTIICLFPPLKKNSFTRQVPLMFFIASFSHHLRDADRWGIWLGPFPSTPAIQPIPYKLYTLYIASLPLVVTAPGYLPVAVTWLKGVMNLVLANVRRKVPPKKYQIV